MGLITTIHIKVLRGYSNASSKRASPLAFRAAPRTEAKQRPTTKDIGHVAKRRWGSRRETHEATGTTAISFHHPGGKHGSRRRPRQLQSFSQHPLRISYGGLACRRRYYSRRCCQPCPTSGYTPRFAIPLVLSMPLHQLHEMTLGVGVSRQHRTVADG